jgi:hypothetical protein
MFKPIAAIRLAALGVMALGLAALEPAFATRIAFAAQTDTVGVLYQFEAALDTRDRQALIDLFTPDARVSHGPVYVGTDGVRDWIEGLMTDDVWVILADDPDVAPTSGQPLTGDWAIASSTISRASLRPLGVDPQLASIAAIIQRGKIAYLAVRSDMLWARQYQAARVMQLAIPPIPAATVGGGPP